MDEVPMELTCGKARCLNQGFYTVPGRCLNCEWEGMMAFTRGHEVMLGPLGPKCLECGCRTLARRQHEPSRLG